MSAAESAVAVNEKFLKLGMNDTPETVDKCARCGHRQELTVRMIKAGKIFLCRRCVENIDVWAAHPTGGMKK